MKARSFSLLSCLFFVSGFSSLVYQVIWLRLAFAEFGVITPIMSAVLSVFMAGLGLGSYWGGTVVARFAGQQKLSMIFYYGLAELCIGIGGMAVPYLFQLGAHALLQATGEMNSVSYLAYSAAIILAALLPWCIAMGATFPLGLGFFKELDSTNTGGFSFLYRANVIGGMTGVLASALVLVELFGFRKTVGVTACINLLIGSVSVSWGLLRPRAVVAYDSTEWSIARRAGRPARRGALLLILFATGFSSLAMEVVWVRAFTRILSTSVYAFAFVLAVYLLATYLGTALYRIHLRRNALFSNSQLAFWTAATALLPLLLNDPRLHLTALSVLLTIIPFCLALGFLTPAVLDEISAGAPQRAASAYALNILGSILGPLAAGYLLLPLLGVKFSLLVLALPLIVIAFAIPEFRQPGLLPGILMIALLAGSAFVETPEDSRFTDGPAIIRRDYATTVVSYGRGMAKRLVVNGVAITALTPVTKFMAHLPLSFLERKPESLLTICFGMGTTFRSASRWGILNDAVELSPSVPKAFGYYYWDAAQLMARPENRVFIDDGRRYLRRTSQRYDVITLDPPPPMKAAAVSLLYSTEFYRLAKTRLTPGGILQQWMPPADTRVVGAVARSLRNAFPYVKAFHGVGSSGYHFLGSDSPLETPTVDKMLQRMPVAAQKDLTDWFPNQSIAQILKRMLSSEFRFDSLLVSPESVEITDDHPYNEYFALRATLP